MDVVLVIVVAVVSFVMGMTFNLYRLVFKNQYVLEVTTGQNGSKTMTFDVGKRDLYTIDKAKHVGFRVKTKSIE